MNEIISFLKNIKLLRLILYFLKKEYKVFSKFNLKEESIFLDLGANRGDVSQFVDDKFNCKIYAYEPDSFVYNILEKKFRDKKIFFVTI